ncbi:MAG TPA: acyltransferase [Sphingobacteriaceae bacterium]
MYTQTNTYQRPDELAKQQGKSNYYQIDTIRFITISIIVWSHSLFPEWRLPSPDNVTEQIIKAIVIQAGATSTIIFFIVSGILIHSKLQNYTLKKYFNERIPRIYAPWLFIVFFNTILIMLHQLDASELASGDSSVVLSRSVYNIVNGLLIYGPYWFVVTYLVGMVLMITFKNHAGNLIFGLILFSITFFYCLNFHMGWIDTFHTKAVLAYTFFIWLGFLVHRHWTFLLKKVENTGWVTLIMGLLLLFSVACFEGYFLTKKGVNDSFASNRFTNIIFSLAFFVFLLKVGAISLINNLQPRKIVYGIYLVNSIVILELSVLFGTYLKDLSNNHILELLAYQFLFFMIVLVLTFIIVRQLANSRLRWIIGLTPQQ